MPADIKLMSVHSKNYRATPPLYDRLLRSFFAKNHSPLPLKNVQNCCFFAIFIGLRRPSLVFFLGMLVMLSLPTKVMATETTIFNTPTALTLERGEFSVATHFYGDGGVLVRGGLGASSYFNLGLIEYFNELIGTNIQTPEIPHAFAKIRIPLGSGRLTSVDLAIGYDSLYHGNFSLFERPVYGIYAVTTLGLPWFKNLLLPQYFSFGIRYPLIFEQDTPDLFSSFLLRINDIFQLATEVSNIHLGQGRFLNVLNNNTLIIFMGYGISLKTTLQVARKVDIPEVDLGLALALEFRGFF